MRIMTNESVGLDRDAIQAAATRLHGAHKTAYNRLQHQPADKQGVTVVTRRVSELLKHSATGGYTFGEPQSTYQTDVDLWQVPGTDYFVGKQFIAREKDDEIFALDDTQVLFDSSCEQLIEALEAIAS